MDLTVEHFLIELKVNEEEVYLLEFVGVCSIELQFVLLADNSARLLDCVKNVVQIIVDDTAAWDKVAPNWVLREDERDCLNMLVCPPVLVVIACRVNFALENRKRRKLVLFRRCRKRDVRRNLDLANYLRLRRR